MTDVLTLLMVATWVVLAILIVMILALARQIGLIQRRLPPATARMTAEGPAIGAPMPTTQAVSLSGSSVTLGGPSDRRRLYAFLGANCASCAELAPALRSVALKEGDVLELVVVGISGTEADNIRFASDHRLDTDRFVLSPESSATYNVLGTPYLILADRSGAIATKGIANHLEQLASLLDGASPAPGGLPVVNSNRVATGL